MDKKTLKNTWGKYCNTDALVDSMMNVLTNAGHRNSEHGVCTILDEYFKKKEPLIKMFMKSKSYIGNMRIVTLQEFDKTNDRAQIYSSIDHFTRIIAPETILLRGRDDMGLSRSDHLASGRKIVNLSAMRTDETVANEVKGKEKSLGEFVCGGLYNGRTRKSVQLCQDCKSDINVFRSHTACSFAEDTKLHSMVIARGTKTSRAFNKVCHHYGLDTASEYNKLFASYSDLVSDTKRKLYFVVSLNPLDYLTMSVADNWTSCHNIRTGGWKAGCLSYMMDATSIITYVTLNQVPEMHTQSKIYREMFHYDIETNNLIQSRIYPQGNDGATDLYIKFKNMFLNEISQIDEKFDWAVYGRERISVISTGKHYKDYTCQSGCKLLVPNGKTIQTMMIGHDGICPNCGKVYSDYSSYISHSACQPNQVTTHYEFNF